MLDTILQWIGQYLAWLDSWTGDYMLALFLFALSVEILMLPFGIKQQKNSIKQARLRPKEMAIRKKYAGRNDKVTQQKMQQEVMDLYQKEGYSQFGGCLPMLIQFPIILALYNIVINPLRYVLCMSKDAIALIAKFLEFDTNRGTIQLISKIKETTLAGFEGLKTFTAEGIEMSGETAFGELAEVFDKLPDFRIFGSGLDLGNTPSFTEFGWLLIVPVLTFLAYFGSMKITRKFMYQAPVTGASDQATGCSNNIMDIMMPAFSVFISFSVPAAVGVYWIFKSIITTVKQIILYKAMPLPQFTEEDYKAAEKELSSKSGKKERAPRDPNAPKVRSLHHIDDDDYDETPSAPAQKKPEISAKETPVAAAPLKDDEDRHAENKSEEKTEEKAPAAEAETQSEEAVSETAETAENTENDKNI